MALQLTSIDARGTVKAGAAMKPKELKTARELEAMIAAELNNPRVKVLVTPDPAAGWHATASAWGDMNIAIIMRAQQIAESLRAQYDLKEENGWCGRSW